jgi:hypothetical protein
MATATARVIYHYEDASWWADSPDVERWSAAADTIEELVQLVIDGVPFALDNDDVTIEHVPAPDLMDVFAGRSTGGRIRVELSESFVDLLEPAHAATTDTTTLVMAA